MQKVILGISGSIAAYKSAALARLLIKSGAEVQVLMTRAASQFISPLTLSTLSRRPVYHAVSDEQSWHNHVELGLWADVMVVAPATANTLARMAHGLCDDILSAVYLSARCPTFVAPAMDLDMWRHPATQSNVALLERHGVRTLPVGVGELASGLYGEGRMAEPEEILAALQLFFRKKQALAGRKALVTAGPTYEAIDPVRFVGNHASGKMGIAIAEALAEAGADTTLVLGPSALTPTHPAIRLIRVVSAADMYAACAERHPESDICVFAAAVADYRPESPAEQKIKKHGEALTLRMVKTTDIAAALGERKRPDQIHVGFALETENESANAQEKLQRKHFDLIALNSLRDEGAGFGHDTNKLSVFRSDGSHTSFALKTKKEAAQDLADEIIRRLEATPNPM
ncbi:MAG: bifunctional phosphopantothenoylcysteine decarboxylase/phosphopantothenate--cysteine ligase CoaBC [Saprospiraceae bacterium]